MPLLAVLVPGPARIEAGFVRTAAKTVSGLTELARYWPGEVIHVTETADDGVAEPLGVSDFKLDELPYQVVGTSDRLEVLNRLRPDIVLGNLSMSEVDVLMGVQAPVVIMAEYDLRNRVRWAQIESPKAKLPRITAGLLKLEARYVRLMGRAAGLQINGWPAWKSYSRLSRRSMLYFDSRVRQDDVVIAREKAARRSGQTPFVFAFSGRWIKPKGFEEAFAAHRRVVAMGAQVELHVFGSGSLQVPAWADESVKVFGAVDYETEWLPHVTDRVDSMLLPYTQSDPACTYLEGLSCGAPFVAFDNRQASYLAGQGLGWTVPVGRVNDLADLMVRVAGDGTAVRMAREKGFAFMQEHAMETEFQRRTQHLVDCAAL